MTLYRLSADSPEIDPSAYVAPGARLIGRVSLGPEASVWFNAVLRADNEPIRIGARSNVQDGAVAHVDPGFPLTVEEDVTVGHGAVIHGCHLGAGSLIGMGATVLNGARIGRGCLIGANALVTEGREIPDRSMVLGAPGKVVRELDDEAVDGLLRAAAIYVARGRDYARDLGPT